MKSLWGYMRERKLSQAIRCSLENFGEFDYIDDKAGNAVRHVRIFPLYAIPSSLHRQSQLELETG